ncbi:unnamed protein product [Hydatigera taeniaeformis]|uniref:S5A_REDUCTASE domain-containing protein n=1 Tax=Hydatigena taeniaeformis TaxID=6205 RepID=A0A0R3WRW1_HYDTA|nr:unnamed protein product [Hydatigera taeniaeformis]
MQKLDDPCSSLGKPISIAAFFMPLFVYWCIFLAVSPTNEESFTRICSYHGCFVAFFGAAVPLDLSFVNLRVLFGVVFFDRIIMFLNNFVPIGEPSVVVFAARRWQRRCYRILVVLFCLLSAVLYVYVCAEVVNGSQLLDLRNFLVSFFLGAWVDALLFAIHALLKSRHIRGSSTALAKHSGNIILDFYNGSEIRPIICGLDIKVSSYFVSIIRGFTLQLVFAIYQYDEHATLSFGLMTLLLFHGIYILDFFIYEPTILHAHDIVYYGCGLRWFQNVLLVWPLLQSLSVLYLVHNYYDVQLSCYSFSAAGAILFILGLYIRRQAINQKFFYHDPQGHSFDSSNSLNATASQNITAVGWWSCVRHPDYLGELILLLGLALTTGVGSVVPWIAPVCGFFDVLLRIHWDERTSLKRYDKTAWRKYTSAVPYRLIPRIY